MRRSHAGVRERASVHSLLAFVWRAWQDHLSERGIGGDLDASSMVGRTVPRRALEKPRNFTELPCDLIPIRPLWHP